MEDPPQQKTSVLSRVRIFEGGDRSPSEKNQHQRSPQTANESPVRHALPRKPMFYTNRDASPNRNASPLSLYAKGRTVDRGPSRADPSGRVSPRVDLTPARALSPSVDPPAQKSLPAPVPRRKLDTQEISTVSGNGRKIDAAWARPGRSTQRGEGNEPRASASSPSPARKLHEQKAFMRYTSLSPSARNRQTREHSLDAPVTEKMESRSVSVPRQPIATTSEVVLATKEFLSYAYRTRQPDDRASSPLKTPQLQRHRWEDRGESNNVDGRRDAGKREESVDRNRDRLLAAKESTPVSKNRAVSIFLNNGRRVDPKPTATVVPKLEPKGSIAELNGSKQSVDAKIRSYKTGSFSDTKGNQSISSCSKSGSLSPTKAALWCSSGSKDTRDESPSPTKTARFSSSTYNPLAGIGARELKRNLNAAATIMKDEKAASVASSSSSSRSELSQEELVGIASRALALSKMRSTSATSADRLKKSPLGQMMSEKRTGKSSVQQPKPKCEVSVASYGSAQRLSDRLSRAERFMALKTHQVTVPVKPPDDDASVELSSLSPVKNPHPVFGYAQQGTVDREKNDSNVGTNADLSVIRKSRLLSKSMQWKASPSHKKDQDDDKKKDPFGGKQYLEKNFTKQAQTKHENSSRDTGRNRNFGGREHVKDQMSNRQLSSGNKSKYEFCRFNSHLHYPTSAEGADRKQTFASDSSPNRRLGQETLDFLAFEKKMSKGIPQSVGRSAIISDQGIKKSKDCPGSNVQNNPFERKLWNDRLGYGDRSSGSDRRPGELSISVSVSSAESSEYCSAIGSVDDHSSADHEYMRQQVAVEVNESYPSGPARHRGFEFQGRTRPINGAKATQAQSIDDQSSCDHKCTRQEVVALHREPAFKGRFRQTNIAQATTQSNLASGIISERPSAFNRHMSKKDTSPMVRKGSKDHLFSDISESLSPNKGSYQRHVNVSSDGSSSATTQDPLQWFHNKYGVGSPKKTKANPMTPDFSTSAKAARVHSSTKDKTDEDDDIFDGLEDETIDLSKLANSPSVRQQFRQSLNNKNEPIPSPLPRQVPKHSIEKLNDTVSPRRTAQHIPPIGTPSNRHEKDIQQNRIDEKPSSPKEQKERSPFQILTSQFATKGETTSNYSPSMMFLDSTTLKDDKKAIRRNPDDPKGKAESESMTEADENEDVSLMDEESMVENEATRAPGASFVDLGVAFVNSIKNSCAVPDKLPEVTACAMDAKMRCVDKINGAFGKIAEQDSMCKDYEQKITVHDDDPTALNKLNDVERRIRIAWDRDSGKDRDDDDDDGDDDHHTAVGDMLDEVDNVSSKSTSTLDSEAKERIQKFRVEAQVRLLEHADKAMQLVTSRTGETANSYSTGPMLPVTKVEKKEEDTPASPSSNLSAKLSFEQRTVLENFSTQLKNQGVEVLKLGRRNRWQLRYLTVSREMINLIDDDEVTCCPKALLWPKQRNPPSCSISSIKDNGRGGLLFDHLKQARMVTSNEHYKHVPKKLKESFPQFAGIVLDYWYNGGGERQLYFCFRSKLEAQAFHAAVLIIKEATERGSIVEGSTTETS